MPHDRRHGRVRSVVACLNSPSDAGEVLKALEWLFISTQFQPEPLKMSAHAFDGAPTQVAFISSRLKQIESRGVFGLREQWDVPAALWCAPTGFDARYPEDGHASVLGVVGSVAAGLFSRQALSYEDMYRSAFHPWELGGALSSPLP